MGVEIAQAALREAGIITTSVPLNESVSGFGTTEVITIPLAAPFSAENAGAVVVGPFVVGLSATAGSVSNTFSNEVSIALMSANGVISNIDFGLSSTLGTVPANTTSRLSAVGQMVLKPVNGSVVDCEAVRITVRNTRSNASSGTMSTTLTPAAGGSVPVIATYGGYQSSIDANVRLVLPALTGITVTNPGSSTLWTTTAWTVIPVPQPVPLSGLRMAAAPPFAAARQASLQTSGVLQCELLLDDGSSIPMPDFMSSVPGAYFVNGARWDVPASMQPVMRDRSFVGWRYRLVVSALPPSGQVRFQAFAGFEFLLAFDDSDSDGLWDRWESTAPGNGIDADGDGIVDLSLSARGATPDRKDIFVEIDAMTGCKPMASSLDRVRDAFAQAPVAGGIALHLDDGGHNAIGLGDWQSPLEWSLFNTIKNGSNPTFGTPAELGDQNSAAILAAKRLTYRYCMFVNKFVIGYDSLGQEQLCSGEAAGRPSSNFFVSLKAFPLPPGCSPEDAEAGTFMHELGHTLGLSHGGSDGQATVNYKPNYKSVMSYIWQMPDLLLANTSSSAWRLDYSREAWGTLDQRSGLDESLGLRLPPGPAMDPVYLVPFRAANGKKRWAFADQGQPVDWDGNNNAGDNASVRYAVNDLDGNGSAPLVEMTGYNDWENLTYNFRRSYNFLSGLGVASQDEFSTATVSLLRSWPLPCPADIDDSRSIDTGDLTILLLRFGQKTPAGSVGAAADLNGDGVVNTQDLTLLLLRFGQLCP